MTSPPPGATIHPTEPTFDLAVVGSSFAATFFLHRYLQHAPDTARVVVLERGRKHTTEQLRTQRMALRKKGQKTFRRLDAKAWWYTPALGGTSNMWFGNTPRMFPEDFRLWSTHGVGSDWPISYDDLEPYYAAAEALMHVSGPDRSPVPRSTPYPLPAHDLSEPEKLLQAAWPEHFFPIATARASRPTPTGRPPCCTSFSCNTCPIGAKFTCLNSLGSVYEDPRVQLRLRASVQAVDVEAGRARGLRYLDKKGRERTVKADLVALGANAIFNPHILLRSGFDGFALGKYLHEQVGATGYVDLDGVDAYQGGTSCTGHFHGFSVGAHRAERAGFLLETYTTPVIWLKPGRWRQRMRVVAVYEDLPSPRNQVGVDPENPEKATTTHAAHSAYAQRAVDRFEQDVGSVFADLPVERVWMRSVRNTEGHILGTARMGTDPDTSVVDGDQIHHRVRNLVCLGGSSFPTGAPANPSLTIAALSLRSAERLMGQPRNGL